MQLIKDFWFIPSCMASKSQESEISNPMLLNHFLIIFWLFCDHCLTICEYLGPFMIIYDYLGPFIIIIYDHVWPFMTTYGHLCPFWQFFNHFLDCLKNSFLRWTLLLIWSAGKVLELPTRNVMLFFSEIGCSCETTQGIWMMVGMNETKVAYL